MMPLMAFVTLISGVWRAGETFQTTCHPMKQARTNTVKCARNSRGATAPSATNKAPATTSAATPRHGLALFAQVPRGPPRRAAARRPSARRRRGDLRRRPDELPILEDDRPSDDLVLEVDTPLLRAAHVAQQVREVRSIELARERRETAWKVDVSHDGHAATYHDFARPRERAVSAVFGGEVHDDGARPHAPHHLFGDERRRGPARNEGRRDDDVDVFRLPAEEGHLGGDELGAHLLGVPASAAALLLDLDLEELGAHALDLLADFGAGVEPAHDGTEPSRGADGAEPGDAGADDEDLRRSDLAGRGHLAGEEPSVEARGLDDGAVARDVGHRAERVDLLGAGDARDLVHRQHRGLAGREPLDELLVLGRPEKADEKTVLPEKVGLVRPVGPHLGEAEP